MIPYLIIFFLTAYIAFVQFNSTKKTSPYFFGAYVFALALFVGISDMLGGYDRYIYGEVFTSVSESVARGEGVFNDTFNLYLLKEPLYGMTNVVIGLLTPNRYAFILIYTLLVYTIYGICFYRYTEKPFFALLVFLGLMFFFTYTYLRQILAVGVIWLALPYYTHRKTWKYLVMVAIATLIHNSGMIMAVLYFIPLKKWKFSQIIPVMILLFVMGLYGVGNFMAFAGSLTGVENIKEHADAAEIGFRYEYVIESCLFLFLLYQNYKTVKNDKKSLSYLNLYLMFCGILLLFCKSGDGGRIAWYSVMGIIIMLTQFCKSKNTAGLRIFLTIMFFALYFRILYSWGMLLYPYKTFFTNGVREGDDIYTKYEYDVKYADDKLYNLFPEEEKTDNIP